MKNFAIVTPRKIYNSLKQDKFAQTKRFDISDKSPFVKKYWLAKKRENKSSYVAFEVPSRLIAFRVT